MCNHKWKVLVSYRHPYMMSKLVVYKKCENCSESRIENQFSISGIFNFANDLIKPKNKVYKKTMNKVA